MRSKTFLQLHERSQSEDLSAILRLDPSVRLNLDSTIFGEERLREDLDLLVQNQNLGLRLTYDRRELLDQRFGGGSDERLTEEWSARLDVRFRERWSTRFDVGQEDRSRGGTALTDPLVAGYDVRDRFLAATLRYRLTAARRIALTGKVTRRKDDSRALQQDVSELLPEVGGDFLYARWTWQGRVARVVESAPPGVIRPFFFEIPGTGRSTALSVQWALGSAFTLTMRYSLRDDPRRDLRQDLSVETRARF
jgi:hypothetical protein